MTQVDNTLEWKLTVPMEKSESGDGRWIIKGIAAGAGFVDGAGDEMLPEAIEKLASQINSAPVPFRNQHQVDDIMEDLGEVFKAMVTPDFELAIEVELDQDNPAAQYLWKKLGAKKQYGMSIRGDTQSPKIEKAEGRYVSKHHTVHLKEVSATTRPYYTHSLGTVLRKAIDEAMPSLATGENTMSDSVTNGEAPAQESSAPENDTVAEATPSNEEVAKAILDTMLASDDFKTLVKSAVAEVKEEEATPETSEEDNTEVEKAETEDATPEATEDTAEIVKSAVEEVSKAFAAQLEELANKIPDSTQPPVLVKTDEENINDALKASSPSERLRAGLAAAHGETDKLR